MIKHKISAGLKYVKESIRDLKHYYSPNADETIKFHVDEIRKNGFSIIKNYYTKAQCASFIQEIDHLKDKYTSDFWIDEQKSDHRLFRAEELSELISSYHTDVFLKNIGEAYLKYKLKNYMTLLGYLTACDQNKGSGGGWHRDSAFSHQFKSIIYLNDVTDDNGPFQICIKSNRLSHVIKYIDLSNSSIVRYEDNNLDSGDFKIINLNGSAGTVILTDTMSIHRGMPIKKLNRYALTNYYVGEHRYSEFESYFKEIPHLTKKIEAN